MKCPDVGGLRAYLDRELTGWEERQLVQHLADCPRCAEDLRQLEDDAALVNAKLALLNLSPAPLARPSAALARVEQRLGLRGAGPRKLSPWERVGAQIMTSFRLGWKVAISATLALCLVIVAALPPVRLAAEGVLQQFRVQKFTAVTVDPTQLPELPNPEQIGTLEVTGSPQMHQKVTLAQAQGMVTYQLKTPAYLPSGVPTTPQLMASDAGNFIYTIDRAKLAAYLQQIGAGNLKVADSLNGAVIRGHVPTMVAAFYGAEPSSSSEAQPAGPAVMLVQGESPTYEVPDDLAALRDELLRLPNLPASLVAQMAAIQDWQSTVVVPVPSQATSRNVTVQGQPGLLISGEGNTALLWQQNGILYGLAGNLSQAELIKVAESLR